MNWIRVGAVAGIVGAVGCSSRGVILDTGAAKASASGGENSAESGGASADAGHAGGSTGTGTSGTSGSGGAGGLLFGSGGSPGTLADAGACALEEPESEVIAENTDVLVLLDQSSSMGQVLPGTSDTRWSATVKGISAFLAQSHTSTSVGVQYFPLNGVAPASCSAAYDVPAVEIGALPGNATPILQSLATHSPTLFTPMGPAFKGALDHMKAWATTHPGRTPIVVLATDGYPTECNPGTIGEIADLARAAATSSPKVLTWVIRLDSGLSNLDQVAAAGGTTAGFDASTDVAAGVTRALQWLTTTRPSPCTFALPPLPTGQTVDFSKINVVLGTNSAPVFVHPVQNATQCAHAGGGWYGDNSADPSLIVLCPETCDETVGNEVRVVFGCHSIPPVP